MGEMLSRDFESIYSEVRYIIENAKDSIYKSINFNMVLAYWNIGKIIVEEEQKGASEQNRIWKLLYFSRVLGNLHGDES